MQLPDGRPFFTLPARSSRGTGAHLLVQLVHDVLLLCLESIFQICLLRSQAASINAEVRLYANLLDDLQRQAKCRLNVAYKAQELQISA